MITLTAEARHAILSHLTDFVIRRSPVIARWGNSLIYDYLGWFFDRGLLFSVWHPDGHVMSMACVRLVHDPLEAAIERYILDVTAEHVFVDMAICHPTEKKVGMMRLWSYVHRVITTNSPQAKYVSWSRLNSPKPIFTYRISRMNNRLNLPEGGC